MKISSTPAQSSTTAFTTSASARDIDGQIDRLAGSEYWERRYRYGGNSGAGSYDRLGRFKAEFVNRFVEQHDIRTIIDHGCGDGAQLRLARYPSYTGIDVSAMAIEICRGLFANDNSKQFFELDESPEGLAADLAISLDVIYHLVGDEGFEEYMRRLFRSASRFVIIYSSNMEQNDPAPHVRHRRFTEWIDRNVPGWRLRSMCENEYPFDPENPSQTSFADFYVFER